MADVFEKRLRRAETLEKEWPFAAELLRFFRGLTLHQRRIHEHSAEAFMEDLRSLVHWVSTDGPKSLAEEAGRWKSAADDTWREEHSRPHQPVDCAGCPSPLYHFLGSVLNQAYRLHARLTSGKEPPPRDPSGDCPYCGQRPIVGVLREDKSAETVRRSLICSLCSLEWEFPRVMCPNCREEKTEKLPRYTAQEIPWMRVDGCDSCGKYLKSVDLTLNWESEPVVDELASTPLDVIAHEHGYTKIAPNLAGI